MNTSIIPDRKPVFDAVRRLLGRSLAPSEISALDAAFDAASAPRDAAGRNPDAPPAPHRLGQLSERFESGGAGCGTVSSGAGDPGGASYGIWQLSSRAGTAAAFVAGEGARWRGHFAGTAPGSSGFTAAWKAIAAREPAAFAKAQHAFIERTHYFPTLAAVAKDTGLDIDSRHPAVRDACWSVAVQHGGAARILIAAVTTADGMRPRGDARYDRILVEAIYAERSRYVRAVAAKLADPGERRTLETVTTTRYPAELTAALAMLAAG